MKQTREEVSPMRLLALAACVTACLAAGCSKSQKGPVCVAQNTGSAAWSKDGNALFSMDQKGLHRYDIRARREKLMHAPILVRRWGISPDERSMVYVRQNNPMVRIADLRTGRSGEVFRAPGQLLFLTWLPNGRLMMHWGSEVTQMDPDGKNVVRVKLPPDSHPDIWAADGSGCIYRKGLYDPSNVVFEARDRVTFKDRFKRYCYCDLATGAQRPLGGSAQRTKDVEINCFYLQEGRAAYVVHKQGMGRETVELLDLATMKARPLTGWPARMTVKDEMGLAPDLRHAWRLEQRQPDWPTDLLTKLWIEDVPARAARMLGTPLTSPLRKGG